MGRVRGLPAGLPSQLLGALHPVRGGAVALRLALPRLHGTPGPGAALVLHRHCLQERKVLTINEQVLVKVLRNSINRISNWYS